MAMYEAKDKGQSLPLFYPAYDRTRAAISRTRQGHAARALTQNEFELCFQPIFELNTPVLRGVEALLRWHHPDKG